MLSVRVTPNSARNALTRIVEDRLGVKIESPPVEGKANRELIRFLAKKLGVPPTSITIARGLTTRDKVVLIRDADPDAVQQALEKEL
jgi:uncharacterized protein (TIGR00251 family)